MITVKFDPGLRHGHTKAASEVFELNEIITEEQSDKFNVYKDLIEGIITSKKTYIRLEIARLQHEIECMKISRDETLISDEIRNQDVHKSLTVSHSYKLDAAAYNCIFILFSLITASDLQVSSQLSVFLRSVPGFKQCSFSLCSSDIISVFCDSADL
ncbi:uncharacterized protein BDCG_16913 [Blastomyces dermatitidis ER-3]|uniref:Uncharacterized protein n=1 Tax=Ajellomyces dermatitidis (strain ER-3 / ATCC MYA-2586) TaxID=559297 RepID=A0ABX2VVC0_AJEDR|nr:uncharacterized protein BDCG_16913 [Blastomyces dermatitidis ER-3]OAT01102.1 hypothetical protein BDCG_16913 [Blastomyces dermatitidis ER-3]